MSAPALAPRLSGSPLVVAGCRLEYRWIPPARATALTFVLLHDGLGSVGLWRDFPERLAQRTGAGVFLYSRAGYGRSEPAARARGADYLHHEALDVLPGHRIRCPVMVVQGEDDSYGTLAQVEAIGRQTAGPVDTLVLPRCGHAPHREAEVEVIEEVAHFVTRL